MPRPLTAPYYFVSGHDGSVETRHTKDDTGDELGKEKNKTESTAKPPFFVNHHSAITGETYMELVCPISVTRPRSMQDLRKSKRKEEFPQIAHPPVTPSFRNNELQKNSVTKEPTPSSEPPISLLKSYSREAIVKVKLDC